MSLNKSLDALSDLRENTITQQCRIDAGSEGGVSTNSLAPPINTGHGRGHLTL